MTNCASASVNGVAIVLWLISLARMALTNASQRLGVRGSLPIQQRLGLFPELFKPGTRR